MTTFDPGNPVTNDNDPRGPMIEASDPNGPGGYLIPHELQRGGAIWEAVYDALPEAVVTVTQGNDGADGIMRALCPILWPLLPSNDRSAAAMVPEGHPEPDLTVPPAPADADGHWERMGQVGVDGASIAVVELIGLTGEHYEGDLSKLYEEFNRFAMNTGVNMLAGLGDGSYDVWGWIIDIGTPERPDQRVAQFTVTLIDQRALDQWQGRA